MTTKIHDQFAKEYLACLLETKGQVSISYEIPKQAFQIDVRFTPTAPAPPNEFQSLGLLGQMTRTTVLLEPFWNPPSTRQIRTCVLKLFLVHNELYNKARSEKIQVRENTLPHLWILATSLSCELLEGFNFTVKPPPWPAGVYTLGDSLKTAVVVINQLPLTTETLWLRLLGRGATLTPAIQELMALPSDHSFRSKIVELFSTFHLHLGLEKNLTITEQELIMQLSPVYQKWREETLQQGVQQGLQQGVQQGRLEGQRLIVTQLLTSRFGELDETLLQVVEWSLRLSPAESIPLLLTASKAELVKRVLS